MVQITSLRNAFKTKPHPPKRYRKDSGQAQGQGGELHSLPESRFLLHESACSRLETLVTSRVGQGDAFGSGQPVDPDAFFGYREPQTPRRIRVRGPSGKAVEVEYAPDLTAPVQRLQAP